MIRKRGTSRQKYFSVFHRIPRFLPFCRGRSKFGADDLFHSGDIALESNFQRSKICSCLLDRCRSFSVEKSLNRAVPAVSTCKVVYSLLPTYTASSRGRSHIIIPPATYLSTKFNRQPNTIAKAFVGGWTARFGTP